MNVLDSLENKLNRTLSFKKIVASLEMNNNKLHIHLDFSKSANEEKRKDYYILLCKTSIGQEKPQKFQEL
ncbi:hypothetical protein AA637_05850 [Cyanobacterium sp. HL-69]|uniref:hypothetical protein n=1 Tax=Cyanobacterium sp. HL-69 TaxID=2054282 RepID=UPI000CA0E3A5|nr:hypothetical protein AA637_05850 [Cyanobacterium sp. HL-69]